MEVSACVSRSRDPARPTAATARQTGTSRVVKTLEGFRLRGPRARVDVSGLKRARRQLCKQRVLQGLVAAELCGRPLLGVPGSAPWDTGRLWDRGSALGPGATADGKIAARGFSAEVGGKRRDSPRIRVPGVWGTRSLRGSDSTSFGGRDSIELKYVGLCPDPHGSGGWASFHAPEGHGFHSWARHLPALRVWSPVRVHTRGD